MRPSRRLIKRIRHIVACGGSTTCPQALREKAVAAIAGELGLELRDRPATSMLAEIVEQYILDCAAPGPASAPHSPALFLDESNVARLLELNGRDPLGRDDLAALTAEAEEWTRRQARQILAFTGSDTATAEQIQEAVLQGLATR